MGTLASLSTAFCRVCGHSGPAKVFEIREMMFGMDEPFEYFQCSACGCLQITEPPKNLAKYYGEGYYSFKGQVRPVLGRRLWHYRLLGGLNLSSRSPVGRKLKIPSFYSWLRWADAQPSDRVLDVGCGGGSLLRKLYECGFNRLTGIDAFLPSDQEVAPGFHLYHRDIREFEGTFDLIMFNHSFEHMAEPVDVLKRAQELLSEKGQLLVRIPVLGELWDRYQTHWMGLDAPRHLYIHTRQSFETLCSQAGLRIIKAVYDMDETDFRASEQYQRGIPLNDPGSYAINPRNSMFSKRQIKRYRQEALELNAKASSNSAAFLLERSC